MQLYFYELSDFVQIILYALSNCIFLFEAP